VGVGIKDDALFKREAEIPIPNFNMIFNPR
jgi:hypothetical protein